MLSEMISMHHESNSELKEAKYAELLKTAVPLYLNRLETFAKENGGYLANKKVRK